jgi:hypothetical protein
LTPRFMMEFLEEELELPNRWMLARWSNGRHAAGSSLA